MSGVVPNPKISRSFQRQPSLTSQLLECECIKLFVAFYSRWFSNMSASGGVCYVYKVVKNGIVVRCAPSVEDQYQTDRVFQVGDLVSIDLVILHRNASQDSENGPFLRLSDDTARGGSLQPNIMLQQWNAFQWKKDCGHSMSTITLRAWRFGTIP